VASWSIQPFGHNTPTLHTNRQDIQRSDCIGRTVLQTVAPKRLRLNYLSNKFLISKTVRIDSLALDDWSVVHHGERGSRRRNLSEKGEERRRRRRHLWDEELWRRRVVNHGGTACFLVSGRRLFTTSSCSCSARLKLRRESFADFIAIARRRRQPAVTTNGRRRCVRAVSLESPEGCDGVRMPRISLHRQSTIQLRF